MSSRQLKKLRAQEEQKVLAQKASLRNEEPAAPDDDNEDDDDTDGGDAVADTRPRAKNPFAAFAALGDGNDKEDDEDKEDEEEEEEEQEGHEQGNIEQSAQETRTKPKPSKKKKKKKKGKGKPDDSETPDAAAPSNVGARLSAPTPGGKEDAAVLDEIDRALEELNLRATSRPGASSSAVAFAQSEAQSGFIKVHFNDLRVLNELREVFGRDTIQAAQADDAGGVPGRPRGEPAEGNPAVVMVDLETFLRADPPPPPGMVRVGGGRSAGAGLAGVVAKRNPFIQWKDTWPRATSGGLGMRQITPDGKGAAAASGGVVEYTFVHSPAYVHLEDTFFTLVMMHNPQPIIQFLKQHPFHISSLIQISRVAKLQDQNASLAADLCERALFSFGRSTLSSFRQKLGEGRARLNPRRPENRQFLLAGYHYVRSLILRGTYRTALAWTKLFLSTMPDDEYALMLYAHALAVRAFEARWFIDLCGDDGLLPALRHNPMRNYIRQSLVPAKLQVKDVDGARAALAEGMASLPWLYGAIFQALNLDVPRAVWGIQPRDDAETLYTQLYVHLTKDIWDMPQAAALIKEVAAAVVEKPNAALLPAAAPVTLSLARFVYLDGTPGLMALAPKEMLHASPNYDFDPLPPPREENDFSNPSQIRPWLMAQSDHHMHMPVLPDDFLMPGQLVNDAEFEVEEPDDDDDDNSSDSFEGEEEEIEVEEQEEGQGEEWRNAGGMPGAWHDDE